jgi:hypothetical protein
MKKIGNPEKIVGLIEKKSDKKKKKAKKNVDKNIVITYLEV